MAQSQTSNTQSMLQCVTSCTRCGRKQTRRLCVAPTSNVRSAFNKLNGPSVARQDARSCRVDQRQGSNKNSISKKYKAKVKNFLSQTGSQSSSDLHFCSPQPETNLCWQIVVTGWSLVHCVTCLFIPALLVYNASTHVGMATRMASYKPAWFNCLQTVIHP